MKNTLIIFLKGFPYNVSEPFIENEYPLYSEFFDKVLIITGCKKNEIPTRVVNDSIIEIICDYTSSKDFSSILHALPRMVCDKRLYKEIKLLFKHNKFTFNRLYDLLVQCVCANHRVIIAENWMKYHPDCRVDTIYSYWFNVTAYAALRLNEVYFNGKCHTITRTHRFDLYEENNKHRYLPFQEQMYNEIDEIASISMDGKIYLENKYGKKGKISIHHLGALDRGIKNPIIDKTVLEIVSCSRIVPVKRVEKMADVLMQITDIPIHWTHIGGSPYGENLLEKLREKIKMLPKNIDVELTGTVSNVEVYEIYERRPFHVFINISESEGVPVSIMEAMSFGIPVIATAVGGTSELIDVESNGYLLDADFKDYELIDLIKKIYSLTENEYLAFRQNAREKFENEYNAIPNYRKFVESLAKGKVK